MNRCSLPLATLLLLVAGTLSAQEGGANAAPPGSALTTSVGVDFADKYYFRGFTQETKGLVTQPWIEIGARIHEGESTLRAVDFAFGTWNSLHSGTTGTGGATSDPDGWYESDLYGGLSFALGESIKVGAVYYSYMSPNQSFNTSHTLDLSVSWDDSAQWEGFGGLQPSAVISFETKGEGDGGGSKGTYLQLGVAPSFTVLEHDTTSVSLTVPVTVGLSLSDYYQDATGDDDFFGFFDVGFDLSMPINCLPQRFGALGMSVGVHFLFLGDTLEAYNGGDDLETIASLGFNLSW